jgi:chloramphenicol-sensitive protein RarD
MAAASQTQNAEPAPRANVDTREGFFYALSAYLLWGFLPFYMKAVAHIPAIEVVAHRIVWSVPLAGAILLWLGRTADLKRAVQSPRTLLQAALCAAIISINWSTYVWAISAGRALETALGYYINPLFSIFLAFVFVGERLTRLQWSAVALAATAVVFLAVEAGSLPWVSLILTVSWGFYALLKKTLPVGPNQGFFLEVLILFAPALGYILWLGAHGEGHFAQSTANVVLLVMSGAVTAIPLMLYANGAKLLRLTTIGIMQYIAPTMIFLIAVFVFREPFGWARLVAFLLIWTALALYSWSLFRGRRSARAG